MPCREMVTSYFLSAVIISKARALRRCTIHKARSVTPALHCLGYSGLVIATRYLYFLLALRKPHDHYSYGVGGVPLPCTTRTGVNRTARSSFAPCRVQSIGSYRHGMGTLYVCLAPTRKGIILTAEGESRYRVARGRTLPARQGVLLLLGVCGA